MRAIQWVGLACLGAASWAAAAGSAPPAGDGGHASRVPRAILPQPDVGLAPGFEGMAYKPPGRLRYLDAGRCGELHVCAVSAVAKSQPNYVRALSLVTYGPMDVKFTGDRVKVRVSF